jgi:ABC-type uncharacterized transport system fused permease/ATPase subunit
MATAPRKALRMALVCVFFTTVVAFWIGHPLIRLSFRNEVTNAAFRYALVQLRDAAEAVGLYRGENAERGQLMTRFTAVIANYRAFCAPDSAVPRLEPVDKPDRRAAPHGRPGSANIRRRDRLR